MELGTVMSHAQQAVSSAVNFNIATQVAASLAAGMASFLAAIHIYIRLTIGKCTCTTDLEGKTAVITGANTGIGYYTALDFAKRKARVIIAGRNSEKIEAAACAIREKTGNPHVVARLLDVSLMKSVRAFVKEYLEREDRLDILVNNAGSGGRNQMPLTRTEEGLELNMATNHLGHFLLTNLLLDKMKECVPSRIVNVSSLVHYGTKQLDVDNLNATVTFNPQKIYSNTKLCTALFARELARKLEGTGVTAYSLHPGIVTTENKRNVPWPGNWIHRALAAIGFKSTKEGAQTSIHCAVAPGLEKHSGQYFADCKVATKYVSDLAKDDSLAKQVWDASAILVSL